MVIVKPSRLGLADAALPRHELPDVARQSHRPAGGTFQRSAASSLKDAADGVLGARAHLTAARTKERFSPHR